MLKYRYSEADLSRVPGGKNSSRLLLIVILRVVASSCREFSYIVLFRAAGSAVRVSFRVSYHLTSNEQPASCHLKGTHCVTSFFKYHFQCIVSSALYCE